MKTKVKNLVVETFVSNGSYKLVALFVTLVLWTSILGRRDRVALETVNIQVLVANGFEIVKHNTHKVQLRLSGPGNALKKFQRSGEPVSVVVDSPKEGRNLVHVAKEDITVPLGVKILEIQPSEFEIEVKRLSDGVVRGKNTK